MGKYVNKKVVENKQSEKDKDLIIAELMLELAEKDQAVTDLQMVVSDIITKVGGIKNGKGILNKIFKKNV